MRTVSIVLPVYNEEAVLKLFHAELRSVLDAEDSRYNYEIIYVLDRSRDASFEVLRSLAEDDARVTVLHLSTRFGQQMSLVAGIDLSRGDAIIMMDCDLQHPPAVIPDLLAAWERGFDVVHGIRRYGKSTPALKRLSSHLFHRLQNALSPVEIEDGSADFRLISRKVADVFRTGIREQNQFLRGLFRWVGFASTAVEFSSHPRASGSTKYRLGRLFTFSIHGVTSFSKLPLRAASLFGGVLSILSLLYGMWSIAGYFFSSRLPAGYATLIVAMMFLGGIELLVLGILGEYIGSIFDEVKKRPLYIIDEVIGSSSRSMGVAGPQRAACSEAPKSTG